MNLTSMVDASGGLTIRDAGGLATIGDIGSGTAGAGHDGHDHRQHRWCDLQREHRCCDFRFDNADDYFWRVETRLLLWSPLTSGR